MPFERVEGWIARYDARHPGSRWSVESDTVTVSSPDTSGASFAVPFPPLAAPDLPGLLFHLYRPWRLGVMVVRRGGFAVASVHGATVEASKVGRRHVQGRSKAGGWSQQRFARRREQQARTAYDAAAAAAEAILVPQPALDALVTAGDRKALDVVLAEPALAQLAALPRLQVRDTGDTGRRALDEVIGRARSVLIRVDDASRRPGGH